MHADRYHLTNTCVATFIGSPTMNLIAGTSMGASGNGTFSIKDARLPIACPAPAGQTAPMTAASRLLPGDHVGLAISASHASWCDQASGVRLVG